MEMDLTLLVSYDTLCDKGIFKGKVGSTKFTISIVKYLHLFSSWPFQPVGDRRGFFAGEIRKWMIR